MSRNRNFRFLPPVPVQDDPVLFYPVVIVFQPCILLPVEKLHREAAGLAVVSADSKVICLSFFKRIYQAELSVLSAVIITRQRSPDLVVESRIGVLIIPGWTGRGKQFKDTCSFGDKLIPRDGRLVRHFHFHGISFGNDGCTREILLRRIPFPTFEMKLEPDGRRLSVRIRHRTAVSRAIFKTVNICPVVPYIFAVKGVPLRIRPAVGQESRTRRIRVTDAEPELLRIRVEGNDSRVLSLICSLRIYVQRRSFFDQIKIYIPAAPVRVLHVDSVPVSGLRGLHGEGQLEGILRTYH